MQTALSRCPEGLSALREHRQYCARGTQGQCSGVPVVFALPKGFLPRQGKAHFENKSSPGLCHAVLMRYPPVPFDGKFPFICVFPFRGMKPLLCRSGSAARSVVRAFFSSKRERFKWRWPSAK